MPTSIPTQKQYEEREAQMLRTQITRIERAPLADRRAARDDWANALKNNPKLLHECTAWLLEGCYGYGACMEARRIVRNKRCNRIARLAWLLAYVEWQCPQRFTVDAYKRLTPVEQQRADLAVERAMQEWLSDPENAQAREGARG